MNPWYTDYSEYLDRLFPGMKVQKLSVNTGFSCPNRDGTKATGGCIYCDNKSFTPSYCSAADPVDVQLEKGRQFFARKYPVMRWLPYFQSYTGTYGVHPDKMRANWERALSLEGAVGLVVGTRPDCLDTPTLRHLADLGRTVPVIVELGAESSSDRTLRLVNRNHTWADVTDASQRLADNGLHVGLHLIMGLPGEDTERSLQSVADSCRLPVESLKLHQLQIVKGTPLHRRWLAGQINVSPYTLDAYLELCLRIIQTVPRSIALERFTAQAPPGTVAAPSWGLKNHEFTDRLHKLLRTKQPGKTLQ